MSKNLSRWAENMAYVVVDGEQRWFDSAEAARAYYGQFVRVYDENDNLVERH